MGGFDTSLVGDPAAIVLGLLGFMKDDIEPLLRKRTQLESLRMLSRLLRKTVFDGEITVTLFQNSEAMSKVRDVLLSLGSSYAHIGEEPAHKTEPLVQGLTPETALVVVAEDGFTFQFRMNSRSPWYETAPIAWDAIEGF